jgi:hypothetical protein
MSDARVQAVRVADYNSQQHQRGRSQQQQIIVTRRHLLQKKEWSARGTAHARDKYGKWTLSAVPLAFYHTPVVQTDLLAHLENGQVYISQ